MINVRLLLCAFLLAGLAVSCGPAALPTESVMPSQVPTGVAAPTISPTEAASPTPAATIPTLGREERPLDAGTYRLNPLAVGPNFPSILVTVPEGWNSIAGTFLNNSEDLERDDSFVDVQFWDVAQVYGHSCQWNGTLFDPGPTVDDLVEALVDVPLRNATDPIVVTLDGYTGKYLEWSVPADIEMDEPGDFVGCDPDGGDRLFKSWMGRELGSDRYHQGPGQVDRVWIVDVDGSRVVIDAFYMPDAADEEREQQTQIVESIRFER